MEKRQPAGQSINRKDSRNLAVSAVFFPKSTALTGRAGWLSFDLLHGELGEVGVLQAVNQFFLGIAPDRAQRAFACEGAGIFIIDAFIQGDRAINGFDHFQQGDVAEPFPQSLRMQLQQRAFPDPPHPAQHFDHRLERKLIQPGKVDISSMHEEMLRHENYFVHERIKILAPHVRFRHVFARVSL